jgi:multidrug transporter EmrE-like cation transporter
LAGAILTEAVATIALAASKSLTKPVQSVISVICFVAAFWLLSFPLRTMPTGIAYAVWSGLGIVLITAVAWVWGQAGARRSGANRHGPHHRRRDRHQRLFKVAGASRDGRGLLSRADMLNGKIRFR